MSEAQVCCNKIISFAFCCKSNRGTAIVSTVVGIIAGIIIDFQLETKWKTEDWALEGVVDSAIVMGIAMITSLLFWAIRLCFSQGRKDFKNTDCGHIMIALCLLELFAFAIGLGVGVGFDAIVEKPNDDGSDTWADVAGPFIVAPARTLVRYGGLFCVKSCMKKAIGGGAASYDDEAELSRHAQGA